MFIHFNIATYQDLEWGDEWQPVSAFNPTKLDTDQWAEAAVSAGMKGAFLTAKVRCHASQSSAFANSISTTMDSAYGRPRREQIVSFIPRLKLTSSTPM